jgi:transcription termination factor NusB
MKDRRIAREIAMQVLFQWEAQGQLSRKNEGEASAIKLMDVEYFLGQFLHKVFWMRLMRVIGRYRLALFDINFEG